MFSFHLLWLELYFLCKTDTVLALRLQRVHRFHFGQQQSIFFKIFWRKGKSGQTSNKSRPPGPSNFQLSVKLNFEIRLSVMGIQITFGNDFERVHSKSLKWGSRGQKNKNERESERERERERERAEAVSNESSSFSSFETLCNKGFEM